MPWRKPKCHCRWQVATVNALHNPDLSLSFRDAVSRFRAFCPYAFALSIVVEQEDEAERRFEPAQPQPSDRRRPSRAFVEKEGGIKQHKAEKDGGATVDFT